MEETEVLLLPGVPGNSMGQGQDAVFKAPSQAAWRGLLSHGSCVRMGARPGMLCVDVMGSQCEG